MIAFTPRRGYVGLFRACARAAALSAARTTHPATRSMQNRTLFAPVLLAAAWATALPIPVAAADPLPGRVVHPTSLVSGLAASGAPAQAEAPRPAKKKGAKASAKGKKSAGKTSSKAARKKSRLPVSVKAEFEFQSIYDDNIFRFSDENLLAFRRGESPWKFGMDTYDDFIASPRFTIDLGRRIIGSKEMTLRVKYTLWQYASNPNKSNSSWLFRLRQPVRSRDAIELSYTYAPSAYIRQLSDRPPFVSRAVPLAWIKFKGTRNAFGLAYSARLSDRLSFRLDGGRVLRFYNRPFLENDQWEWNAAGTATVRLSPAWSVAGKYQYANAESRALDTAGETPLTSDDGDGSAERDLYQGTLAYSPKNLWKISRIELMGQTMAYYYTTERPYFDDPTHTGRKDEVSAGELTIASKPVYGPVTLELGYRYSTRSSSSAATDVGADAIEEDKNYEDNRVWLGMTWPL